VKKCYRSVSFKSYLTRLLRSILRHTFIARCIEELWNGSFEDQEIFVSSTSFIK